MTPRKPFDAAAAVPARGERRRLRREVPASASRARLLAAGRSHEGSVHDLTRAGMRLRLPAQAGADGLRDAGTVELTLACAGGPLRIAARVAWATDLGPHVELGLTFDAPLAEIPLPTLLDVRHVRIDPVWALRVPAGLALRRLVLPIASVGGEVQVACADPTDVAALKALERFVPGRLRPLAADPDALREVLRRLYGDAEGPTDVESPAAVCNELLHAAWLRHASDVHIDPTQDAVRVRFRVDGELEEYRSLPARLYPETLSRIKVLGGMDIAERRAPQDGRFTQDFGGDDRLDIRVATLPTKHGERVTLRLLAGRRDARTLEELGMSARDRSTFERSIRRPHGLLLATGPTGCGKTTTLYAALRQIIEDSPVNVITVEDPIEYDIPGVAQVEVDHAQKVSFAKAIRSILRHDPDVLMIAEIRDQETVDVAMKAALTGHLVLASLHTNSAVSAVTRLDDMGVERYLTAATLRLAMSQRLARRLCSACRRPAELSAAQARSLGRPELLGATVYEPVGCTYCGGRGYDGRVGLFELLSFDEQESRAVARGDDEAELARAARAGGSPSILDDAVEKLRAGETSLHEVLAAVAV